MKKKEIVKLVLNIAKYIITAVLGFLGGTAYAAL